MISIPSTIFIMGTNNTCWRMKFNVWSHSWVGEKIGQLQIKDLKYRLTTRLLVTHSSITSMPQFIQPHINSDSWSRKDYTVWMVISPLNCMEFESRWDISPFNSTVFLLQLTTKSSHPLMDYVFTLIQHIYQSVWDVKTAIIRPTAQHTLRGMRNDSTTLPTCMWSSGSTSNREIGKHAMANVNL